MNILAVDLGKNKSVACFYDALTQNAKYQTIRTVQEELLALLRQWGKVDRLVIETGTTSGWVYDLFAGKVAEIQVANPNGAAWQWRKVKCKTDRKDALKLAQMSAIGQLPTVHMPSASVRQKRSAIAHRRKVIARRTAMKNTIRAILQAHGLHLASGKKGWTRESLAYLESLTVPMETATPADLWRARLGMELRLLASLSQEIEAMDRLLDAMGKRDPGVIVVTTIAGVGPRLGEALVATLDDPRRFKNGKQVSSYVGMVPRKWESGQMSREGRITKCGNSDLRALLVEASWLALRYNPWLREIYERALRGDPKRKKIAIVAAARHLLVTAWAMLRDGTVWQPPTSSTAAVGESVAC